MAIDEQKTAVSRDKYWEEDSTEGKIERLRDEVARLCKVVTEQARFMAKFSVHQHASDGRMMTLFSDDLERKPVGLFAHDDGIPHRLRRERERR